MSRRDRGVTPPSDALRLEVRQAFRRHRHRFARPRVATRSGGHATDTEAAESPNLNPAAVGERRLHGIEEARDGQEDIPVAQLVETLGKAIVHARFGMTGFHPSAAQGPAFFGSRTGLPRNGGAKRVGRRQAFVAQSGPLTLNRGTPTAARASLSPEHDDKAPQRHRHQAECYAAFHNDHGCHGLRRL